MTAQHRLVKHALVTLVVALALVVVPSAHEQTDARATTRVLFIGNSYTYFNNLGDLLAGIAAADPGGPTIVPELVTRGGATLRWHLDHGPARDVLQSRRWDVVVLQEQSLLGGTVVDGKVVLGAPAEFFAAVREWVRRIKAVGATPVLYMTWARREDQVADADQMQSQLAETYFGIGRDVQAKVAPVGLAWREARRRLRTLDLHIWDGSHPTAAGSYLAASVLYATLTDRSPVGAPALITGRPMVDGAEMTVVDPGQTVPLAELGAATAAELQKVAWDIVRAHR